MHAALGVLAGAPVGLLVAVPDDPKVTVRLSPPDSPSTTSGSNPSTASRSAVMSSRIAVCGQQPVWTATIRSSGSTALRRRKSASSVV